MKSLITVLSLICSLVLFAACGGDDDGGNNLPQPDSTSSTDSGSTPQDDAGNLRDCKFNPVEFMAVRNMGWTSIVAHSGVEPLATVNVLHEKNGLTASSQSSYKGSFGVGLYDDGVNKTWVGAKLLVTVSKPGTCLPVQKYVIVGD